MKCTYCDFVAEGQTPNDIKAAMLLHHVCNHLVAVAPGPEDVQPMIVILPDGDDDSHD